MKTPPCLSASNIENRSHMRRPAGELRQPDCKHSCEIILFPTAVLDRGVDGVNDVQEHGIRSKGLLRHRVKPQEAARAVDKWPPKERWKRKSAGSSPHRVTRSEVEKPVAPRGTTRAAVADFALQPACRGPSIANRFENDELRGGRKLTKRPHSRPQFICKPGVVLQAPQRIRPSDHEAYGEPPPRTTASSDQTLFHLSMAVFDPRIAPPTLHSQTSHPAAPARRATVGVHLEF